MKLDELKKKLYKPEVGFEDRLEGPDFFQSKEQIKEKIIKDWEIKEKKEIPPKKKEKIVIIGISIAVVFIIISGFFIWRGFTSFDKNNIELEINSAERVVSGEEIKYIVKYKNNTRLTLENVKLIFHYPEDSIPSNQKGLDETIDLPDLVAGQEKETELLVRIIGLRGENKKAWVELTYQPINISSQYTNSAEFINEVISVPLILDFDIPDKLVTGQSFDFSLRYVNQAEVSFDDVQIRLDYPDGFVFESANIEPIEEDRIWSLGKLMAGEQGNIFIRASIQGEEDEIKSFKSQLGLFKDDKFTPYTEAIGAIRISSSPLSVIQTVNNTDNYITKAGEKLNYSITYKNTTDIGISNIIITSKIQGQILDLTSLDLNNASFDGETQTIIWNIGNTPDLEYLGPYESGQLNFSVNIKSFLPINNYNDKNFTVSNSVKIDSLDIPIALKDIEIFGHSQLITKMASQITLQSKGYYYDDLIPNQGPIPPKLDQVTSYTIKWRLINTSNDLKNVKVSAFLPPHVKWNNKVNPGYDDLKYNTQTGQIIWTIGDLPAATGILLPVREVAFQVKITPSMAHLGGLVELIGQSNVMGQDDFVNLELTNTSKLINTDLPDDLNMDGQDGIVVE